MKTIASSSCFYCATAAQKHGSQVLLNWIQHKASAKFNKHAVDLYANTMQFIWQQYDFLRINGYQYVHVKNVFCFA